MENVLVIEEVVRVIQQKRLQISQNLFEVESYYYLCKDRKLKLKYGKSVDELKIRLHTIDGILHSIKNIQ